MTPLHAVILAAAGILAGIVGTAGAITSLVSYPALLAVGLTPLAAAIANVVALTTAWPGSALASRPELGGRGRWVARFGAVAAVGGCAGAALLVSTPASAFRDVVPFLVALGALALLATPWLARHRPGAGPGRRSRSRQRAIAAGGIAVLSIYGGYFGAGSGVMLLALCLVMVDDALPVANACKNMLVGAGNLAAALVLVAIAPVDWSAVVPLGIGVFAGATIGPSLARHLPAAVMRPLIAAVGLGLAVQLWVSR